ncbi:STAGA complex 65 subunit gamma-like isoform X2 [Patiria miniata]|uniref:Bromodomain associated domain-containing protein n=1 Tax=Patiria miniata TaxID=46514 RepID=A0A914A3J0_PATMI|nr:STAGA complex 65 subunit gamma-like isoform X2 [Patiria miniata]
MELPTTVIKRNCDGKLTNFGTLGENKAVHHWGEFVHMQCPTKSMHMVDMDLGTLTPKSLELEGPHLHQPTAHHDTLPHKSLPAELCRPDAISIHTIQLMKHNRRIRTIIAASQQLQTESNVHKGEDRGARPRLQSLPATPLMLVPTKRTWASSSDNMGQLEQHDEICKPTILNTSVQNEMFTSRKLSRRAVATICAHAGYEMSQESATETLTDVLHEYLTKVCKLLRGAVDKEALTSCTGFQDVLSQVLQEIGIGDTETLFKFWKAGIKDYHAFIQKRNSQLREQYDKLRNPGDAIVSSDSKSPRFKEEPFIDIQFPDNEQDSEIISDVPEQPNQPLNLHSLNAMELEDQSRATSGMTEEGNHWYPSAYIKTEPGTEAGSREGDGQAKELQEHSNDEAEEVIGPSHSSTSPVVDVDVTSPQAHTGHEMTLMNPRKKRKK